MSPLLSNSPSVEEKFNSAPDFFKLRCQNAENPCKIKFFRQNFTQNRQFFTRKFVLGYDAVKAYIAAEKDLGAAANDLKAKLKKMNIKWMKINQNG